PDLSPLSFTHTPTTQIYTLSLHDALPISVERAGDEHWDALRQHHEDAYPNPKPTPGDVCKGEAERLNQLGLGDAKEFELLETRRSEEHTSELQSRFDLVCRLLLEKKN